MKLKREFIEKVIENGKLITRGYLYYDVVYNPCVEYETQNYYSVHCIYRRSVDGKVERIGFYNECGERI